MKKQIAISEALALRDALKQSFDAKDESGRAVVRTLGLTIGGITVPEGTPVHFTPTKYGTYFNALDRDSEHAILFLGGPHGSSIRVDGSFTEVTTRHCA